MPLTLTLVDRHQLLGDGDTVREMSEGTLTIGRSTQNDWVLPDPERIISSQHCSIEAAGDGYRLTDTSANGVFLNGADEPVGRGNTVPLNDGDRIRISHFVIDVSVAGAEHASVGDVSYDVPGAAAPMSDDPFADDGLRGPDTSMNIDDILEGSAPTASPPSVGEPAAVDRGGGDDPFGFPEQIPPDDEFNSSVGDPVSDQAFFQVPDSSPQIPDDWDKDWSAGDASAAAPIGPAAPSVDPFADPPATIPEEWGADAEEPPAGRVLIPEDPFGVDEESPPSAPEPAPVPRLGAGGPAPDPIIDRVAAPPTPPSPSVQPAPAPAESASPAIPTRAPAAPARPVETGTAAVDAGAAASQRHALKAFLEGAELDDLDIGEADAGEVMRLMGSLYRETVTSLMAVLAARSSIKSEFRLSQTVIKPVENNPLKFSLGATDAMTSLLTKRGRDYLPPLKAVREAFDDVKAHQVAVMVGMQVAITELLKRFDPAAIERRIEADGKGAGFSLKGKDSRYWSEFTRLYETMAAEAEDDFQSLFGREFARAYEQQVRKLAGHGGDE